MGYHAAVLTRLIGRVAGPLGRLFRRRARAQPEVPDAVPEAARGRALLGGWLARLRAAGAAVVAAVGLITFGAVSALVSAGLTAGPDLAASLAVQQAAFPLFGVLMLAVSAFGLAPLNLYLVVGVALGLWLAGYALESRYALLAGASGPLGMAIKGLIGRPRPQQGTVRVVGGAPGTSFPSGHVLFYTTFFGFIAYLAYRFLKPGRLRTLVLGLCTTLIVLVGPSRVWLGQHWATDVLASYALGLAYLIVLVQLYNVARRRRAEAAPGL